MNKANLFLVLIFVSISKMSFPTEIIKIDCSEKHLKNASEAECLICPEREFKDGKCILKMTEPDVFVSKTINEDRKQALLITKEHRNNPIPELEKLNNNPTAFLMMGVYTEETLKNTKKAAQYFEESGQKGEPLAWVYLGDMYSVGAGVEKDIKKAENYYDLAIRSNEKGAVELGEQQLKKLLVSDINSLMEKMNVKAAENGDTHAMGLVANQCLNNHDYICAYKWATLSLTGTYWWSVEYPYNILNIRDNARDNLSEKDYHKAYQEILDFISPRIEKLKQNKPLPEDKTKNLPKELLKQAVDQGSIYAYGNYARLCLKEKDYQCAYQYSTMASLGNLFWGHGEDVLKIRDEARKYLTKNEQEKANNEFKNWLQQSRHQK